MKHDDITGKIIKSFYDTYNNLGFGFDNEIYKNGLVIAFLANKLKFEKNKNVPIKYELDILGNQQIDFLIMEKVIVTVSNNKTIQEPDLIRLYNIIRNSEYEVGLCLNFGLNPEHKRREIRI
jgi:GxxExxY protein